ncbi:MAG: lamin tail domain-containing protein [Anaerolineae bacterium]|nr:lamin tail domain-containing protein [Anaerolineae bacterium]
MARSHRSLPLLLALLAVAALANAALAAARWGRTAAAPAAAPAVLIDSVLFDGYALDDADEAVRLVNTGATPVDLSGWRLGDGADAALIPGGTSLAPGATLWLARDAAAFRAQFGHEAGLQLAGWPSFSNSGDEVVLADAAGATVDVLVYLAGDTGRGGWIGPALAPYRVAGLFAAEGQILFRRRDEATGRPVADTDTAANWGQHTGDPIAGRKVRYPGWAVERFAAPTVITATGTLTVAVAPDNAYDAVARLIDGATTSIRLSSLTLEHAGLGAALARAAGRGVAVAALLDGAPPGGLSDQERYVCAQLEAAGGACWFMADDAGRRIHGRYRYLHAKYLVIDDRIAAVSSENFSPDSLPDDDKSDGTWGHRGVVLITDARAVATYLAALFAADLDIAHADLRRWTAADPVYGAPPAGFVPITASGGISYTVRFPQPAAFYGTHRFEIIQSPENSLRAGDGLLALLGRAGEGDALRFEQLSERPHWGATGSTAVADPNPRLEAALAAARRGADVALLLDSFFDDAGSAVSNEATCDYVNGMAAREGLRLRCATGNPTGLGIHNKMVLARIGGRGVIHVGSLNGTELSHKANREVAVQVWSDGAYAYLARVFAGDMTNQLYLPLALAGYQGAADHLLISEIVYDPPGPDEAEFVELVNPTGAPIDLTGYALGDAVSALDFEDMRHFPAGAAVPAGGVVVVALSASAFRAEYDVAPQFEIVDSDPTVPDMLDDPAWGDPAALFQLGNAGDEVVVIRWDGLVDVVTYGDGYHSGVVGCGLLVAPARTLERRPYWRDTDSCPTDFRDWPFASPGSVAP